MAGKGLRPAGKKDIFRCEQLGDFFKSLRMAGCEKNKIVRICQEGQKIFLFRGMGTADCEDGQESGIN